jgi:hypothetical protein
LFMKVERNPKDHFIIISSRVMKQVKWSGKPSEHTINQSGKRTHD